MKVINLGGLESLGFLVALVSVHFGLDVAAFISLIAAFVAVSVVKQLRYRDSEKLEYQKERDGKVANLQKQLDREREAIKILKSNSAPRTFNQRVNRG